MAQIPATPKRRRAMISLLAPLGLATRLPLARSERAALALRKRRSRGRPQSAHHVTFLIPLVGAHHVDDWHAVEKRLRSTLNSLIAQTDPNWRAVICCQTAPALPDDPRIQFLAFDDPAPGNDKWRKLAALGDWLKTHAQQAGYVMSFDADDLLHDGAVAEMLNGRADGYLVTTGYVMDHATGDYALARPQNPITPGQKALWKLCGSCCALFHDPAVPESAEFLQAMTAHEHRMFPYLARLSGAQLVPLQKPTVLYILNHGENFGARRGRVGFKTRFVQRFKIRDKSVLTDIADHFPEH